jgi:hypothetical protein
MPVKRELAGIRAMADKAGIAISGVCSFLFWPYPLTANSESIRARSLDIASRMIAPRTISGPRISWWFRRGLYSLAQRLGRSSLQSLRRTGSCGYPKAIARG